MADIQVQPTSVNVLLRSKLTIDYYQREYRWEKKQIIELLDDLYKTFQDSHDLGDTREDVKSYGDYFLGQIIINKSTGRNFIVDGQQRLTSLTLILIYIHRNTDGDQKSTIHQLIFSEAFGERSFNLDVSERAACMEALLNEEEFETSGKTDDIKNIIERYQDIEKELPHRVSDELLPLFADWLIHKVVFVEITANSAGDAYTLFETMNDRGLPLTPREMLKGYLLSSIDDTGRRDQAGDVWKEKVISLGKGDEDAIKAWLRSQHAMSSVTIREPSKEVGPGDFEKIGTEFHRWVRSNRKNLGLDSSMKFYEFIVDDFAFYAEQYARVRELSQHKEDKFEAIYYNAQANLTLQYPVLLAPLLKDDTPDFIGKKLRISSSFLDILLARINWNNRKTIDYSTYAFSLMKDIRGKAPSELLAILEERLKSETESFDSVEAGRFRLRKSNSRLIRRILARLTDFIEVGSGREQRYEEFARPARYEIEHIWSNKFEDHAHQFGSDGEFDDYRNRIGGLILLPKNFNRSYGAKSYQDKLPHYFGHNLLARSLNERSYDHDTGFRRFCEEMGLDFQPHDKFDKEDLETRHRLYQAIAEQVWHPNRLRQVLDE